MLRPAAIVALCLSPTLAPAEVTPREVWDEWRSGPLAVTAAAESTRDGALILDGVTAEHPQGGRLLLGQLTLAPDGDDVRVTASDTARLVAPTGDEADLTAVDAQLTVSGDSGALTYALTARDIRLTARPADLPLDDLTARIADLSLDLDGAAAASAAPADVDVDLRLDGVTFSDQIWDLVDPARRLQRGPARLRADLSARGQVMGDPSTHAGPLPPVVAERLRIDALRLDALGARADIEGRLDWDGATGAALLAPEGRLTILLDGAEALVADLVAAGVVTEGQALFAQIGLSQFTRPAEQPGRRASEIEFGPGGTVTVNGVALR